MDGEFSLDELAERSGVSARTIRYYQSEGVLIGPRRDGRDARYNPGHLERLELIAELQERGLKLEAIKSLLSRVGKRSSVSEWLGIDEALRARWADDSGCDHDTRRGPCAAGTPSPPARR